MPPLKRTLRLNRQLLGSKTRKIEMRGGRLIPKPGAKPRQADPARRAAETARADAARDATAKQAEAARAREAEAAARARSEAAGAAKARAEADAAAKTGLAKAEAEAAAKTARDEATAKQREEAAAKAQADALTIAKEATAKAYAKAATKVALIKTKVAKTKANAARVIANARRARIKAKEAAAKAKQEAADAQARAREAEADAQARAEKARQQMDVDNIRSSGIGRSNKGLYALGLLQLIGPYIAGLIAFGAAAFILNKIEFKDISLHNSITRLKNAVDKMKDITILPPPVADSASGPSGTATGPSSREMMQVMGFQEMILPINPFSTATGPSGTATGPSGQQGGATGPSGTETGPEETAKRPEETATGRDETATGSSGTATGSSEMATGPSGTATGPSGGKVVDFNDPAEQMKYMKKFFRKLTRKYNLSEGVSGPSGSSGPSGPSSGLGAYTASVQAWENPENPLLPLFPSLRMWKAAQETAAIELGLPSGPSGPSGPYDPSGPSGPYGPSESSDDDEIFPYINGLFMDKNQRVFASGQTVTPEGFLLNEDESVQYIDDPDDETMDIPILVKGTAVYDSNGYDISQVPENMALSEDGKFIDEDGNVIPNSVMLMKNPLVTPPYAPLADPAVLRSLQEGTLRL